MAQSIADALNNIKDIFMSDSSLSTLLDMERVLDELDVYAFKNWKLGELVEGPVFEKYFVSATFMWPYKKMPDPRGGEQLLNYHCEVKFKKDKLEFPTKPKSPDDFKPGTKLGKMQSANVWLVTITMPKQLMTEIQRGSLELENDEIDLEDLESAYEDGTDEEATVGSEQQAGQPEIGGAPEAGGMPPLQQPGGAPGGF